MTCICYIHGLGATPKTFNYLRYSLPSHDAILVEYDASQRIMDSFEQVKSQITSIIRADQEYTIIGHSLGGIVGALIAHEDEFAKLITISSPFGGSTAAEAMKWMFPNSPVLWDLIPMSTALQIARQVTRQSKGIVSFISTAGHVPTMAEKNDGVVSIESQRQTPGKQIDVDANHFEIVQDNAVVREILTRL